MLKVKNTMAVYEINGTETKGLHLPEVEVESHWNNNDLVVLVVEGKRFTVRARDLQAAITNATNSARF